MIISTKEHNYVKHIRGVAFYVLCTSSDDALHGTKFCENIINGFRVIKRTLFP